MPRLLHTDWPQTLWVVRHGQSAGNVARDEAEAAGAELIDIDTRDADTPLSPLGHRQSRALGRWFEDLPPEQRPTAVLTSPFVRSEQTARAVAGQLGNCQLGVDERLREKEFGVLDRYTVVGIAQRFPELHEQRGMVGKFYFRPPGGESWCDVILRLRSVVEELRRDYVGERVLIVAHQVIVNCFRYLLEGMDEAQILAIDRKADVPNCSITEYGLDGSGEQARFQLRRYNMVLPLLRAGAPVTADHDASAGPR